MTAAIEQYKRRLKRRLRCDSVMKQQLMGRFEGMLNVYLGDSGWPASWPGKQDLENAFGSPEQMARILMDEIPANVTAKYRKKKKVKKAIVAILIAALVLLTVYIWIYKDVGITSVDDVGPVETPGMSYIEMTNDNL